LLLGGLVKDLSSWALSRVDALHLYARPRGELFGYVALTAAPAQDPGQRVAELRLLDATGATALLATGLVIQRGAHPQGDDWFLSLSWERSRRPATRLPGGRWLLLDSSDGAGAGIAAALEARGHSVFRAVFGRRGGTQVGRPRFDPSDPASIAAVLKE